MLPFASDNESKYVLNSIAVITKKGSKLLRLVATDGKALAVVEYERTGKDLEGGEFDEDATYLLPREFIKDNAAFFKNDKATHHGHHCWLSIEGKRVTLEDAYRQNKISSKLIEGNYPRFEMVIPTGDVKAVTRMAFDVWYMTQAAALFKAVNDQGVAGSHHGIGGAVLMDFRGEKEAIKLYNNHTRDKAKDCFVILMPIRFE